MRKSLINAGILIVAIVWFAICLHGGKLLVPYVEDALSTTSQIESVSIGTEPYLVSKRDKNYVSALGEHQYMVTVKTESRTNMSMQPDSELERIKNASMVTMVHMNELVSLGILFLIAALLAVSIMVVIISRHKKIIQLVFAFLVPVEIFSAMIFMSVVYGSIPIFS